MFQDHFAKAVFQAKTAFAADVQIGRGQILRIERSAGQIKPGIDVIKPGWLQRKDIGKIAFQSQFNIVSITTLFETVAPHLAASNSHILATYFGLYLPKQARMSTSNTERFPLKLLILVGTSPFG